MCYYMEKGRLDVSLFIYLFICGSSGMIALMLCYHSIALCTFIGYISASAICYLWSFILVVWNIGRLSHSYFLLILRWPIFFNLLSSLRQVHSLWLWGSRMRIWACFPFVFISIVAYLNIRGVEDEKLSILLLTIVVVKMFFLIYWWPQKGIFHCLSVSLSANEYKNIY